MAAMVGGKCYHRRLDRGPDKADFYLLPEDDRRLISNLRCSMEGAREKITKLRDVLENKDKDVSRQAALRRAAEVKLEHLIDMYGDPAVMEELNDRLPHARRTGRRTRSTEDLREASHMGESGAGGSSAATSGSEVVTTVHRSRSAERDTSTSRWRSRQQRRSSFEGDIDSNRDRRGHRSHSPSNLRSKSSVPSQPTVPSQPFDPSQSSQPIFPPSFNMSPPYPIYMPSPAFPYVSPQMFYMPQMQGGADRPENGDNGAINPIQGGQGCASVGGQVMTPTTTQAPFRKIAGLQMKNVSFVENTNLKALTTPVTADTTGNHSTSMASSPRPGGSTDQNVPTRLHMLGMQQDQNGSREQNRQISLLLTELNAAKDLNIKLQEKLMTTGRELESLKITCKLRDAELESVATSKAAVLVEEIYIAQKKHDEAMIGRMRTANEDRDEALMKLKHMDVGSDGKRRKKGKRYESGSDDYLVDKDIHRLLNQLDNADSSTKVNHHGERIVDSIKKNNQRRHRVTTEEMKAVLEERDIAVMKNRKLECELLHLQRQHHGRSYDHGHQEAAQAKLMATQQERDMAMNKLRKCQDELEKLRLYYNLHKSLSQEEHLRDEFNATLEAAEGELRQREAAVDQQRRVNAQLTQQLKASVAAKMKMTEEVAKAVQAQKAAEANNERLERLVNVLRRKINGLGSKSEDY